MENRGSNPLAEKHFIAILCHNFQTFARSYLAVRKEQNTTSLASLAEEKPLFRNFSVRYRTKTSTGKMAMTPLFYVMAVPSYNDILLT
jgi:hypothetical protein